MPDPKATMQIFLLSARDLPIASAASARTLGTASIRAGLGTHSATEVPRDAAPRSSSWNQPLSKWNERSQGLLRRRQALGQRSAQEAVRLGGGWCELEQSAFLCLRRARDSQAMVPGVCGWGRRGCTGLGSLAPGPRLAAPFCLCSLAISVFPVRCP